MLTACGRLAAPGGSEIRTPGRPDPSSARRAPGVWTMQNRPLSSVIRWPETRNSENIFWPGLGAFAAAALTSDMACIPLC